jgi:FkbM family methyltransferase
MKVASRGMSVADRIKTHPQPARLVLSRLLWASRLCGLLPLSVELPEGIRVRFHPTAMSATMWLDPAFSSVDRALLRAYLQPGDTFVDVGANVGVLSLAAGRRVGSGGLVLSLEAHPRTYRYLIANIALNGMSWVRPHCLAAGPRSGRVRMTDLRSDDQNYLLPSPNLEGVSVEMAPLDGVVPGDREVAMLKLDVEGFELPVLEGARSVLARTACIYFECWERHCRRFGYGASDLFAALQESGFGLFRWDAAGGLTEVGAPSRECENFLAIRDHLDFSRRMGTS